MAPLVLYLKYMGFLSGLGSFISDAQQLGDELSSVKEDLVSQVVSATSQVSSQVDDVLQELTADKDAALGTLQDSADSLKSSVEGS